MVASKANSPKALAQRLQRVTLTPKASSSSAARKLPLSPEILTLTPSPVRRRNSFSPGLKGIPRKVISASGLSLRDILVPSLYPIYTEAPVSVVDPDSQERQVNVGRTPSLSHGSSASGAQKLRSSQPPPLRQTQHRQKRLNATTA